MIPSHCYSMCLVQTVISLNNNAIFLSSFLLITNLIMEVFGTTPKIVLFQTILYFFGRVKVEFYPRQLTT